MSAHRKSLVAAAMLAGLTGGLPAAGAAAAETAPAADLGEWVPFSSVEGSLSGAAPCLMVQNLVVAPDKLGHESHAVHLKCQKAMDGGRHAMFLVTRTSYPGNPAAAQQAYDRFIGIARHEAMAMQGHMPVQIAPNIMQERDEVIDYALKSHMTKGFVVLLGLSNQCVWSYSGVARESMIYLTMILPRTMCPAADEPAITAPVGKFFDSIALEAK